MKKLLCVVLALLMLSSLLPLAAAQEPPVSGSAPSDPIVFSHPAGLYPLAFELTLTTGYADAVIRYTINGDNPTAASAAYTSPIEIRDRTSDPNRLSAVLNTALETGLAMNPQPINAQSPRGNVFKGNVIKAQLFSADGEPISGVFTRTYIVNSQYGNLPIISIALNNADDLFHPVTGLYVNTTQRGNENPNFMYSWEYGCYVEFFEPDGTLAFSQDMAIRTHGGMTRRFPQKSLRLYAKSPGPNWVEYDLFNGGATDLSGDPISSFRRILLRNGGNDNGFDSGTSPGDWGGAFMRDALIHTFSNALNVPVMGYRPAVALINGEFWGIYNLRERVDEYFVQAKYGLPDADNIGILEWEANDDGRYPIPEDYPDPELDADYDLYKEMQDWFEANPDLSAPALYERAQRFVDIGNFIDYYIIETFTGNQDWPSNNNCIWRYQTGYGYPEPGAPLSATDGRWRYILKDLDASFGALGTAYTDDPFARLLRTTHPSDNMWDQFTAQPYATLFFRTFCTNPEFRDRFINRFSDILNTYFRADVINGLIDGIAAEISPAIPQHRDRWRTLNDFTAEVGRVRSFADSRGDQITRHMRNQPQFGLGANAERSRITLNTDPAHGYIRINGINIAQGTPGVTNPASWSGRYFTGQTQTLTAVPRSGYRFEKFVVGDTEYTDNPLNITLSADTAVTAVFVPDGNYTIDETTGTVTFNLDEETLEQLIAEARAAAAEQDGAAPVVTFDLSGVDGAKSAVIALSAARAFEDANTAVNISLPAADITLPLDALTALASLRSPGAALITVSAEIIPAGELEGMQAAQAAGYETVVNIRVLVDDGMVSVPLTVALPYAWKPGEEPSAVRARYMDEDGRVTDLRGVYSSGMITFTSDTQGYFAVGYDPVALWVNEFDDVIDGAWYYDAVAYANYHGLFAGMDNRAFGPQSSMTRAMFATVLWRMAGMADTGPSPFTDVPDDEWYSAPVTWAAAMGIVEGDGGLFSPHRAITRQEMAVMLYRYAAFAGYEMPSYREMLSFSDREQIDEWAAEATTALAEACVMSGSGSAFYPRDYATRAEVAQLFINFMRFVAGQ